MEERVLHQDSEENLRDQEDDSQQQYFSKRLKRGVKRICAPDGPQSLMNLLGTSKCMEKLHWDLYAEGKDPRLQPPRLENCRKRKIAKMPATSIARLIVADDYKAIRDVERGHVAMLRDASFFEHLGRLHPGECDPHSETRATILKGSAGYTVRIVQRCESRGRDWSPLEWISTQGALEEQQRNTFDKFHRKRPCCLRPFMCRRLHKRLKCFEDTQTGRFQQLVDFIADDGEALTSVRNELQHTRFNKVLKSKMTHGVAGKMNRIRCQQFVRCVGDDHETRFPPVKKSKWKTKQTFREAVQAVAKFHAANEQKRLQYKSHFENISLGIGRTARLHYVNVQTSELKKERGRMSRDEWERMRADVAKAWDELPAVEKAPYELAVAHARESRHLKLEERRRRRRLGLAHVLPRDEAIVNDTDDNFATLPRTLWGIGCPASPLSPEKLLSYLADKHGGDSRFYPVAQRVAASDKTVVMDKNTGFNKAKLSAWRSKVRSCSERHPGLCVSDDLYHETKFMFTHFNSQIVARLHAEVGNVLLRWQPCGPGSADRPTLYTWWAWTMQRPQRHVFVGCTEDEGLVSIAFEATYSIYNVYIYSIWVHLTTTAKHTLCNCFWDLCYKRLFFFVVSFPENCLCFSMFRARTFCFVEKRL